MPMNLVIQEKRKALGLTQEQVAEYLGVSIPAVSKWEKGSTNPDLSLLPPLARLLKVDLNTLFCFQEDLSPQEIERFCREVTTLVQTEGLAAGFRAAEQKIHEYPHNETLLHCLTLQLDGLLTLSGQPADELRQYDDRLAGWYRTLAESSRSEIRNSADYMMAARQIRNGNYEKAQEILDVMPDKEDIVSAMADKKILQVNLCLAQGETEKAMKDLQSLLLPALNKVQMLLYKMVDVSLTAGKLKTAESIADKASRMPALFDLWEYNSYVAPLQVAGAEKNAEECIRLLRKLLAAMLTPWDKSASPLFDRIAAKASGPKQMLPALLSELEQDSSYAFLWNHEEYKELIAEYKALASEYSLTSDEG